MRLGLLAGAFSSGLVVTRWSGGYAPCRGTALAFLVGMDGARVLVVDDDPDWLVLMKDGLEREGYTVATAPNGRAALEQLSQFEPFVVVTDLQMPVLDGRQLLSKVHAYEERVPIIVVTADRAQVAPGLPGAFRVIGKLTELEGVLSAVADAASYHVARLPSPNGRWRCWGRVRGAVASTLSRFSSISPPRLVLLTFVVVSSVVLVAQVAPRLTHAA